MPHAAGLYYEWHGPEDGHVLILSSGLGGSANYWSPNLSALSQQYRVLLYDHRGTGRSERDLPADLTIDMMADDLRALMAELAIKPEWSSFIGHAIGGLIGLEIAMLEGVRKLVIINGWTKIDRHTERCFDARLALLNNTGPEAFVSAQPIFLFPANWIAANEDLLAQEAAIQLQHFPGLSNVEKRIAAARAFSPWSDMPGADILALAAEDDILVPSTCSAALIADLCDIPELALMKWGGHACNVTDPDTFNRIVLDFLRS